MNDPEVLDMAAGCLRPLSDVARDAAKIIARHTRRPGVRAEALSEVLQRAWEAGHMAPEWPKQAAWRCESRERRQLAAEPTLSALNIDPDWLEDPRAGHRAEAVDLEDEIRQAVAAEPHPIRRRHARWLADPQAELEAGYRQRRHRRRRELIPAGRRIFGDVGRVDMTKTMAKTREDK